jgi:hypothetical protein
MAPTKRRPNKEPSITAGVRHAYNAIVALTDSFCREHLNDQYQTLCRKLAGVLAARPELSFDLRLHLLVT